MEQENKEITASVVFVENTDLPKVENKISNEIENQTDGKKLPENTPVNNENITKNTSENLSENSQIKTEEKNDKPIIEHKQTTGVASYVSVPEITITPENVNVKSISTIAVFDYLFAIIITLLFTTKIKTKLKEKIKTKLMTPIKKHTFLGSVFCLILGSFMFLKSDFFNIGVQGKLSFGVNLMFIIFINITAILLGIYSAKKIREKSKTVSKISGEKFAIWGLSTFNIMSILLFFLTESLFGLVLTFILTFITSIIFFKGKDKETFENFYNLSTTVFLFQIMTLGIFFKSSSIIILFCLLLVV